MMGDPTLQWKNSRPSLSGITDAQESATCCWTWSDHGNRTLDDRQGTAGHHQPDIRRGAGIQEPDMVLYPQRISAYRTCAARKRGCPKGARPVRDTRPALLVIIHPLNPKKTMLLLSIDWTNLHELLRSLYDEMMPLCEDMASVAKGWRASVRCSMWLTGYGNPSRAEPMDDVPAVPDRLCSAFSCSFRAWFWALSTGYFLRMQCDFLAGWTANLRHEEVSGREGRTGTWGNAAWSGKRLFLWVTRSLTRK